MNSNNIRELSKRYLDTLVINEAYKKKIIKINADSDYIVFSAVSTEPVDIGVTEYNDPDTGELDRFSKDYGGFKKVDEEGYLLVDDSEYNPFYPRPLSVRLLPLERKILDGVRYKRDSNGYLKAKNDFKKYSAADHSKGEEDGWERFQHARAISGIPVETNTGVRTTRNGLDISGSDSLMALLEEVWNKVTGSEDGHDIQRIFFPYGAGIIDTPAYLNQSKYCVLPNKKEERDKLWVAISKKSFKDQEEWNYSLSFSLKEIEEKKIFKLYQDQDLESLVNELSSRDEHESDADLMTDKEYNNFIEVYSFEHNPIIREFNELKKSFYDDYEKYWQKYPDLVKKIDQKLAEKIDDSVSRSVGEDIWVGRKINLADSEAVKNSLKKTAQQWFKGGLNDLHFAKLIEASELLKDFFEKASSETLPEDDSPSDNEVLVTCRKKAIVSVIIALNKELPEVSDSDLDEVNRSWKKNINDAKNEAEINNIRDRLLIDIASKRRLKKQEEKIRDNLQTEGKDSDQLKRQFEEAEELRGQKSYEDNKASISNLREELSKKISQEDYLQIVVNSVEIFLLKCGVEGYELTPEISDEWEKLKEAKIKEFHQINQAEEKIVNFVGEKGSEKKLNSLFREAKDALKTGKKIKETKNRLNSFRSSNVIYDKSLVSQKREEIESYLVRLENYSTNNSPQNFPSSSDNFPWGTIVSVFFLVAFIGGGIIVYWKRKQKTY